MRKKTNCVIITVLIFFHMTSLAKWILEFLGIRGVNFHAKFRIRNS